MDNKRITALTVIMAVSRADLLSLLDRTNDELADLPPRLYRTAIHDELVSTVSVLMSTCEHLDRAISNLNHLKEVP